MFAAVFPPHFWLNETMFKRGAVNLEAVIDDVMEQAPRSSRRLSALADHVIRQLDAHGLPGVIGGSGGELRVEGLARDKDWDVAYEFAGKFRLLISLKSMWANISGTVPNRIDDHMGETANVQHLRPEIVIGYVMLFDVSQDSRRREDNVLWSDFFEAALKRLAIRAAPLWNQGLLEGLWFIRFDSTKPSGHRLVDPAKTAREGRAFFRKLVTELHRREPAIALREPDWDVIGREEET